jgi:CheY-like chemotaxis protein
VITDPEPLRVLLVEDNPGDARIVREMLAVMNTERYEVVAAERLADALNYVSDDPPEKLLDFYKKELGKYGEVLECKNGVHEQGDVIKCNDKPGHDRDNTELVVGTKERQHIVSVKPEGTGAQFALVYVQTRGKEGML